MCIVKQIKKVLYLLGLLIGLLVAVLLFTGIVQIGMMVVAEKNGFAIAEDLLYHISGSVGIGITALIFAFYVKRKKYAYGVEPVKSFHIGKALVLIVFVVCVCRILLCAVTTMLFARVLPMADVSVSGSNTYIDILFAILVAPVMEELLFRMGIYSMLRRKFGRVSSIVICALAFAVIHGYQLQGFLSCLVGGLVFTLIYDKTGNIGYSIAAHMACNISSTITNAMERAGITWFGLPVQYEINGYNMYHIGLIIIAVIFCSGCLVVYNKKKSIGIAVQAN